MTTKKQNGDWFWVADPHFNHANIIKYCKRPFLNRIEEGILDLINKGLVPQRELKISQESTEKMDETILNSINMVVGENDNLVIAGDLLFARKEDYAAQARKYRNRINCRNIYLILGNHDHRKILNDPNAALFSGCYDQFLFNVNGQKVFTSHYPCRSWPEKGHSSWMIYGHTHSLFTPEDNGQLMPYQKKVYSEEFYKILKDTGSQEWVNETVQKLLDVVASTNGIDLTLDVGVDNVREGIPFGTPWSIEDIHNYMKTKKVKSDMRKAIMGGAI